jgi:DUF1680 family protein
LEKILLIRETNRLKPVSLKNVAIEGGFWGDRQRVNRDRTIPAITHQMEITGRIDAWNLNWQPGQKPPHIFWDSDAGKWIEAISYSLAKYPNEEFERKADEVIDMIEKAQQPDGYLNIYYTAVEPEKRWTNLRERHELYDAGHLIEAAVAYYEATGKRKLLDVLTRYADHIITQFGPEEGKRRGYPGHPELELALVKLYRETGEERYLNLSKYFVDERGQSPHYFDVEAVERGDDPRNYWAQTYHYCQAHAPIRDQHSATGHSVRAAYLYSGVADIVAEFGDEELRAAVNDIWDDLTSHQMYITGGLGPAHTNEGFTFAYDLPNESAYAETCASIALAFWAQRMFLIDPDSKYTDVMERALYNGVLAGVAFDGETFFYANPLASFPKVNPYEQWSGITSADHYRRSEWFDCACCPPNLARIVADVNSYFYAADASTVYVHLYNQNEAAVEVGGGSVGIQQETQYPWDGAVKLTVTPEQPAAFELALRIPGWCSEYSMAVNGETVQANVVKGYARLNRTWANGDTVTLNLAMPVERILPNPEIRQDAGNIALQRGPVVYCLEETDNVNHLANVIIPADAKLAASFDAGLFGGVGVITGEAYRVEPANWKGGLYQPQSQTKTTREAFTFKAIPYAFWANREPGEMRVWLREN